MLTNFHLPKSTLLMLVSAFSQPGGIGGREHVLRAYAEAAAEASATHEKPVLVASELAVTQPDNPMVTAVRDTGRLCYPSADRAVAALGHLVRYAAWHRARI